MKNLLVAIITLFLLNSCGEKAQESPQSAKNVTTECDSLKQILESNKKVVADFYQQMFGDKDITAVDRYISAEEYIQHNPTVADGAEAFKEAAKVWFEGAPKTKVDVQRIAADGDLVFIHVRNVYPNGNQQSVIDIFRLKDGKIVEHWDVMQDVPPKAANDHPMF